MKIFLFLVTISLSTPLFAWDVKVKDNTFFLTEDKKEYEIFVDVGQPKFLEEKQLNESVKVVIYRAGEVGTQSLRVIQRCLVFKKGQYVDNVIYAVNKKGEKENIGTKWTVSDSKVSLKDLNTGRIWNF